MFLQPKRSKYKKLRKGKLARLDFKKNKLKFGCIGLKTLESGFITARQIESARQTINKKINGKIIIMLRYAYVFDVFHLIFLRQKQDYNADICKFD